MARKGDTASWTYELPPGASGAWGIEDYGVETADGERRGTVAALLAIDGDVFVAIERGVPPARHDLRAVEWDHVVEVDPADTSVRLDLTEDELERSLRLAPEKKVEGKPAQAKRILETPEPVRHTVSVDATGPQDRPLVPIATAVGGLGAFAVLGGVVAADASRWWLAGALFAVAAALFTASTVLTVRVYRSRRPTA